MARTRPLDDLMLRGDAPSLVHALTDRWVVFLVRGLAAVALGVLAFARPDVTLMALAFLVGIFMIADGLFSLIAAISGRGAAPRWWLAVVGVAGLLLGGVMIARPDITAILLVALIAAWAIVVGVVQIVGAVRLRREIEGEWLLALSGLVCVVFGVLVLSRPGVGAAAMSWTIGAFALLLGILHIVFALRLRGLGRRIAGRS